MTKKNILAAIKNGEKSSFSFFEAIYGISPRPEFSYILCPTSQAMLGLDKDKEDKDVPETDEEKLVHSIKLGILAMQQGNLSCRF